MSPSSSGGGSGGTHPLEPIGTTSRAESTRASKVKWITDERRRRRRRRKDRKLRMQVWLHTTYSLTTRTTHQERQHLGEIQLTLVFSAADGEDMRPQKLWFDPFTSFSSSSPSSYLERGASRTLIFFFSPTGRQTGGLTQARHDVRIFPTWDSRGIHSAAERATACDTGCRRSLNGPSSCSVAWGRTGWGAPTCHTPWVPECPKGRDAWIFQL